MKQLSSLLYLVLAVCTSMTGYTIHSSLFWAVVDFLFCPIAIVKWLICHELTLKVIQHTFNFFTA